MRGKKKSCNNTNEKDYHPTVKQVQFLQTSLEYYAKGKNRKQLAQIAGVLKDTVYKWFSLPKWKGFRKWYAEQMKKGRDLITERLMDRLFKIGSGEEIIVEETTIDGKGKNKVTKTTTKRALVKDQLKAIELHLRTQGALIDRVETKNETEIKQPISIDEAMKKGKLILIQRNQKGKSNDSETEENENEQTRLA